MQSTVPKLKSVLLRMSLCLTLSLQLTPSIFLTQFFEYIQSAFLDFGVVLKSLRMSVL